MSQKILLIFVFFLTIVNAAWGFRYYAEVTASVSPTGAGSVYASTSQNPTSGDATATSYSSSSGGSVTLHVNAIPTTGYLFSQWEFTGSTGNFGDASSASTSVTVDAADDYGENNAKQYYITAKFKTHWARASVSAGTGGSAYIGTSAAPTSGTQATSNVATAGEQVTFYINAVPEDAYNFDHWLFTTGSGTITSSSSSSTSITVNASSTATVGDATATYTDYAVQAVFTPKPTPTAISASDIATYVGGTTTISPILTPADAYSNLSYTSANTSIATVDASGAVTGIEAGSTTITIQAYDNAGTDACSTTVNVTVRYKVATPVIAFSGNGTTATTTITCATPSATIYYSVNGGAAQQYTSPFTVNLNDEVTAYAVSSNSYYDDSDEARATYVKSGVAGGVVTLNDLEDHNWTYYSGVDASVDGGNYNTNYAGKLYSPNPRNVKITYQGNGGAVSIDNPETTFVYYETLEQSNNKWLYTTIANPFSKRPVEGTGNDRWRGFSAWQVVSISKGSIKSADGSTTYAVGSTIPAETEIQCVPADGYTANCISVEVVLKAVWVQAYRYTSASNSMSGSSYETNFLVVTSGSVSSPSSQCTVMAVEPDGSADYRSSGSISSISSLSSGIIKMEYIKFTGSSVSPAGQNLYIGRGVTTTNSPSVEASNTSQTVNQLFKIESGTYSTFENYTRKPSSIAKQWIVFGNDYDRAVGNNDNLNITGTMYISDDVDVDASSSTEVCRVYSKSGQFVSGKSVGSADADQSYYFGFSGNEDDEGFRYLEIQGGIWKNIAGGMGTNHVETLPAVTYRIKGGTVQGSIYGAAQFAGASGLRTFIFTGGTINGWVAGGANGTQSSGGQTDGTSYIYVGGNAQINSSGSTTVINRSVGGNVFGAGCGYSTSSSSGKMTNGTNVVIADNAYVERGVYGGGSYGYTEATSNIYITGGHVGGVVGGVNGTTYSGTIQGGVYGGACQNKGGSANIYMTGGLVEGGIYGGSNSSGTLSGSTNLVITGGQVGTAITPANVHGGGYGSSTIVSGNVDVTLGKNIGTESAPVTSGTAHIYGDVYGGSALGKVNGTASAPTAHTNVTMYGCTVHGNLYGGGLGDGTNDANVYGPVTVKIYGGQAENAFGCNKTSGSPQQNTNHLYMYGGDIQHSIYGGGNAAPYTGTTYVEMSGGVVHEHVFGGGLGANAVVTGNTEVTIKGSANVGKNVYGGGNAAVVTGDTHVVIGE